MKKVESILATDSMKFMALGGSNHIGASCYYIELAGTRVLLDLGRGFRGGLSYSPDFNSLLNSELFSLSQLDAVLLSHAHYDHAAALPEFIDAGSHVPIFATAMTKALLDHLLLDRFFYRGSGIMGRQLLRELQSREASSRIHTIGYGRAFTIGSIEVTFYEAGHVPGAAMIFLKSPETSVLYTGDFMIEPTALTAGTMLPKTLRPDVTILCGTHAKHPDWIPKRGIRKESIVNSLRQFGVAYVTTSQLTKGLEITNYLSYFFPKENLYLDAPILKLAHRLEDAKIAALTSRCLPFPERLSWKQHPKGIYIGGAAKSKMFHTPISGNISLHASFSDCVQLLRQLESKAVFLVHSEDNVIGEAILRANVTWTTIICPKEGHMYSDE